MSLFKDVMVGALEIKETIKEADALKAGREPTHVLTVVMISRKSLLRLRIQIKLSQFLSKMKHMLQSKLLCERFMT